jgi:hypothetical protein
MTGTIAVRVEGTVGLDEPAKLLEELTAETGLPWRQELAAMPAGTLDGGVTSMVLEAVIGGFVGSALQIATQRVVDRWRGERLDPPTVVVVVQQPPGPGPARDLPAPPPGPGSATPGVDGSAARTPAGPATPEDRGGPDGGPGAADRTPPTTADGGTNAPAAPGPEGS